MKRFDDPREDEMHLSTVAGSPSLAAFAGVFEFFRSLLRYFTGTDGTTLPNP